MKIIFDYEIFTKQKYGGISNYFCCIGNEIVNQNELLRIIAPIHKNFYLDKFNKNNKFGYNFFFPNKLIKPIEKLNQLISNRLI